MDLDGSIDGQMNGSHMLIYLWRSSAHDVNRAQDAQHAVDPWMHTDDDSIPALGKDARIGAVYESAVHAG